MPGMENLSRGIGINDTEIGPQGCRPARASISALASNDLKRNFRASLRDRRRRCGRSVLAVSVLDLGSHFFQTLSFVDHFHHVTRDADADVSGKAHSIKYQL